MTATLNALAHELNQPLTAITLHCDAALTTARSAPDTDPDMVDDIEQAAAGAYHAGQIVASLRQFMTKPDPAPAAEQLNRLVEVATQLAGPEAGEHDIEIDCRLDPRLPELAVSGAQIVNLILALLRQSIVGCAADDASPCAITVSTEMHDTNVEIRITSGASCLVGRFDQLRLLDPVCQDAAGLNAAVCRLVVDAHNGSLWVERIGERQSAIVVSLPMETGQQHDGTTQGVPG